MPAKKGKGSVPLSCAQCPWLPAACMTSKLITALDSLAAYVEVGKEGTLEVLMAGKGPQAAGRALLHAGSGRDGCQCAGLSWSCSATRS